MNAMRLESSRYFPSDAEIVEYCNGAIQVGLYESNGCPVAILYKGKARKPAFHYRFRTPERRQQEIDSYVSAYERREAEKLVYRAKRKEATRNAAERIQIGDIFSASWGYEQTNVDYYQVVAKRGSMIDVREIACAQVAGSDCGMSAEVVPARDHFISDEIITKRIQCDGPNSRPYIAFSGFNDASLDDGSPQYRSWYY